MTVRPSPCQRGKREQDHRGLPVNRGERFIQQDDPCILKQQTRKKHPLKLPSRKRADGAALETLKTHACHGLFGLPGNLRR